jgi:hypothetical protein
MSNFFYRLFGAINYAYESLRWNMMEVEPLQVPLGLFLLVAIGGTTGGILVGKEGIILGMMLSLVFIVAKFFLNILYENHRGAKKFFNKYYSDHWFRVKNSIKHTLRSGIWAGHAGFVVIAWNLIGAFPIYVISQIISTPVTLDAGTCQIVNGVAIIFSVTLYPLLRKGAIWLYNKAIAPVLLKVFWLFRTKVPFMKGKLLSSEYYTIRADQDTENFLGRLGVYDKSYPSMWDTRDRD